jgi:glycosyltransferase
MKKKIFLFTVASRATEYGIGTYINQLVNVLKESNMEFTIVRLFAEGHEVHEIEKEGYKQIFIPFPVSANTKNAYQYYARNVAYLLKELTLDDTGTDYIFHLNFMTDEFLVRNLKRLFRRCKIILVAHYTNWSFALLGNYHKLNYLLKHPLRTLPVTEKKIVNDVRRDVRMIKRVDKLVCVAQHTLRVFHKLNAISPKKSEIISNALEDIYTYLPVAEKTKLHTKYYIEENTKIIVFAGRLDEVKGISFLIRAFKKVLVNHPNCRLFIAGEGNFNEWLKESADCWSKITFTGRLDKKKLYELYRIADVGVVCSLHEEFGFVAIEMLMHAVPVIVTKTGGLDEIVEDTISGLKIPVKTVKGKRQVDINSLSEKIHFLLENPTYAKELGENGRKRFLDKYELNVFKRKILNLYNTI